MNERIKQLAEKASKDNEHGYPVTLEYTNRFAQKLAELIVLECCRKLETDGMVEVAMEMKEHFGVEE
jgi:hypothetical protein